MQKFTASHPLPDQMVTQYFTKSIAVGKKLIGTTDNLTND
jgi:hypothetical protein